MLFPPRALDPRYLAVYEDKIASCQYLLKWNPVVPHNSLNLATVSSITLAEKEIVHPNARLQHWANDVCSRCDTLRWEISQEFSCIKSSLITKSSHNNLIENLKSNSKTVVKMADRQPGSLHSGIHDPLVAWLVQCGQQSSEEDFNYMCHLPSFQ